MEYHSALKKKKKKLTIDKNTDEPGAQGNKPDKKAEDSRFHSCEESEAVRLGEETESSVPLPGAAQPAGGGALLLGGRGL